jgi:hypothetical protein
MKAELGCWSSASWRWWAPARDSSCWRGMLTVAGGRSRVRFWTAGACTTRPSTGVTAPCTQRPTTTSTARRSSLDGRWENLEAVAADRPARGVGADGERGMAHRARPAARARDALPGSRPGRPVPLRRRRRDLGTEPRHSRAPDARPVAPRAAGICCHSIQLDPSDPQRMYVGITSAGTFRTDDGGATWTPLNKNVAADFLPDASVEVGQCVHKLLLHPARPERLWQQTTAVSFGPTTTVTPGSGSTGTGCRAASALRSCSTRRTGRGLRHPGEEPRVSLQPGRAARGLRDAGRGPDVAAHVRRPARASLGGRAPPGLGLRRRLAVLRHLERLLLRTRRRRHLGRGGAASSTDPVCSTSAVSGTGT